MSICFRSSPAVMQGFPQSKHIYGVTPKIEGKKNNKNDLTQTSCAIGMLRNRYRKGYKL